MVIPGLVLGICSLVAVAGAVLAVVDARRVRTSPVSGGVEEVRARLSAEFDLTPLLAWVGLAALTVLGVALVRGRSVTAAEVGLAVFLLGLAADRADYVARTRSTGGRRAVWTAGVTIVTVAAGITLGFAM